ncbi:hypothetical protein PAAG_04992 [Paracoccidioides lutzii Pb01]|uniref:Uncharacterized protein n=1 Tax=Paracoccidioides lutzii (strain ATCC MYA-826 / Pb01) TaxID=502779 RepID=C1H2J9_PARBA|nr:hypothetical protein PAAG_04992 [Paracoccidioides lutzii Pb01]EEH33943.2 hypothetical protein PAAG_04992 [Paracoccidioides lutzii Pb01]
MERVYRQEAVVVVVVVVGGPKFWGSKRGNAKSSPARFAQMNDDNVYISCPPYQYLGNGL